jgi:hypothetical protein
MWVKLDIVYTTLSYIYKVFTNASSIWKNVYDLLDEWTIVHIINDAVPYTEEIVLATPHSKEVDNGITSRNAYLDKYKDKLKKFEHTTRKYVDIINETEWDHLMNSQLLETTPFGNVLMHYSSKLDSFVYYSDRVIPYDYVDTVGRKYAMTYQCTSLYITTLEKEDPLTETVTSADNLDACIQYEKEQKLPSVFAKLKRPRVKKTNENAVPCNGKINRYTYAGKLSNFTFLKQTKPTKKLSYSDFKNKHTFVKLL